MSLLFAQTNFQLWLLSPFFIFLATRILTLVLEDLKMKINKNGQLRPFDINTIKTKCTDKESYLELLVNCP